MKLLLITLFFILGFSAQLLAKVFPPYSVDLKITYEVEQSEFKKLIPFYSYTNRAQDDHTDVIFRADNQRLFYDRTDKAIMLEISGGTPFKLADADLSSDTDKLFPLQQIVDALTIRSIQRMNGKKYKVKMCSPFPSPLPFLPNCPTKKIRAHVEMVEAETAWGDTFCSKTISDYRSYIHDGSVPSGSKFYGGPCKQAYLKDQPFIYRASK
jgi:hypothetical protein